MTIPGTGNRWQAVVDGRTVASPQYGQKPRRSPRPLFPFIRVYCSRCRGEVRMSRSLPAGASVRAIQDHSLKQHNESR